MDQHSKLFAGFKIKGLRIKNQQNLQEVAKALDITPSYLSSIENGKKEPSSKVISKAATYFNVKEADFHESSRYLEEIRNLVKDIDLSEMIQTFETILHEHERDFKD